MFLWRWDDGGEFPGIVAAVSLVTTSPKRHIVLLAGRNLADPNLRAERVIIAQHIGQSFVELFREETQKVRQDASLILYEPGYRPPETEKAYLRLTEHPGIDTLISQAVTLFPHAADFTESDQTLKQLKLVCARLSSGTGEAYFIREYAPSMELTRKWWLAVTLREGTYDRVDQPILVFDRRFDLVMWDGYLYVLGWYMFERLLGDQPEARQRVAATLQHIQQHVPIANYEEFLQACQGQLQLRLKVLALEGREYLNTITAGELRRVAEEYGVDLTFTRDNDGREAVVFERDARHRFNLLKVLENACVTGALGNVRYVDASSKRPVPPPQEG